MEIVTSSQNPAVKLARSLEQKKYRTDTGLFVAEGVKILAMARQAGWQPHTLFLTGGADDSDLVEWAANHQARCLRVSDKVMTALSAQGNPPAAIALLHQRWAAAPQQPRTAEVWLALEDIRDPGNLGTIIRTVDAAGAAGVILVGTSCDPFSRDCVRATMGSLFNVPLVRIDDKAFAVLASQWPGDVIGTFMKAERDFRTSYRLPALIVMGSEGTGISPAITSLCTAEVRIPMAGKAESLNVAIASALILYEVRRAALK